MEYGSDIYVRQDWVHFLVSRGVLKKRQEFLGGRMRKKKAESLKSNLRWKFHTHSSTLRSAFSLDEWKVETMKNTFKWRKFACSGFTKVASWGRDVLSLTQHLQLHRHEGIQLSQRWSSSRQRKEWMCTRRWENFISKERERKIQTRFERKNIFSFNRPFRVDFFLHSLVMWMKSLSSRQDFSS